jgi:hypothetical protein
MKNKIMIYLGILLFSSLIATGGYYIYNNKISIEKDFINSGGRKDGKSGFRSMLKDKKRKIISKPEVEKNSSLYIETDAKDNVYSVGKKYNLSVYVSGKKEVIDGVEFLLKYNPQKVELTFNKKGDFFSNYLKTDVNNETGEARIVAVQDVSTEKSLEEELVASFNFNPLEDGDITFQFDKEKSHVAAYGGQDLLGSSETLLIEVK